MARPKKTSTENQAAVRIEHAFWRLLETEPYSNITVLRIAQESGVNRNSFYYHYKDMEDLAYKAFIHNADPEVTKALLSTLLSRRNEEDPPSLSFDPLLIPHAKRIMLCAGSDSSFLNQMVRDLLRDLWLKELSIKEDLLSSAERLQIRFIFSGLAAALGSPEVREFPPFMSLLSQSDIGKTAIDTLKRIAQSQKTEGSSLK